MSLEQSPGISPSVLPFSAPNVTQPDARASARRLGYIGLVSSQTSGTLPDAIRLDPGETRLQRMRRRVLTGARLHVSQVLKWRAAMFTLTYHPEVDWDKRHISECLRLVRKWLKSRGTGCRYVWVMETTKAGKPHYHVVIWLPWGVKVPKLDSSGWWPWGMTRMEWARCAVGYVSKYVSKGQEGAKLPKGARMYGVGGLEGEALDESRWWILPGWLRGLVSVGEKIRPRPGGGWVNHDTGEFFSSPWRVLFRRGAVFLVPREAVA
jgi:hypothetical protein